MPDGFVDFLGGGTIGSEGSVSYDLSANLSGGSTFSAEMGNFPADLSVTLEGGSSFTANLTLTSGSVVTPKSAAVEFVGGETFSGDLIVTEPDPDEEEPENPLSPCNVEYDIETCGCVTI